MHRDRLSRIGLTTQQIGVDRCLQSLCLACRRFAAVLDLGEVRVARRAFPERCHQQIRRRDGVLDGKIDAGAPTGDLA